MAIFLHESTQQAPKDAPVAAFFLEPLMYEKKPDYACNQCHRTFKDKRALSQHNKDAHQPAPTTSRLASGVDTPDADNRRNPIRS